MLFISLLPMYTKISDMPEKENTMDSTFLSFLQHVVSDSSARSCTPVTTFQRKYSRLCQSKTQQNFIWKHIASFLTGKYTQVT